ncbi:hypothetical protein AVEN_69797-1 [Araneus ventricosus]|uniref:DDE-1 domain-containing protein n=1 Tax=Araneus ventricosus TaxID=182803 RepID=A0A4Y2T5E2_ARAVE|nr:hypothetical protein AVEN_69797-1 [Araneus ventricosus]
MQVKPDALNVCFLTKSRRQNWYLTNCQVFGVSLLCAGIYACAWSRTNLYVIQNIKLGYRKLLLTTILNDPLQNENLEKTQTNVNLKDVVISLANCWASVSTLLINKSWKNSLPNFIDSEVEENVQTEEIQLVSLINQLQNTNPMSNTEVLQWAAEADDGLAQNKMLTDDEIIRTVTAEDNDDDDDDVTPVNPIKISHSEAGAALITSLQWAEGQNFEAHEIMLLRRLRDRAFELKT